MRDDHLYLQCWNACLYRNKIYFYNVGFNGLFSINVESLDIDYLGKIPSIDTNADGAFGYGILVGNKYYLFPNNNTDIIAAYNIDDNVIDSVNIHDARGCTCRYNQTSGVWLKGNDIFFISPNNGDKVFLLKTDDMKVERHDLKPKLAKALECGVKRVFQYGNLIVFLTYDNRIVEYNQQSEDFRTIIIPNGKDINKVYYHGGCYWIISEYKDNVLKLNAENSSVTEYRPYNDIHKWRESGYVFSHLTFLDNSIYISNGNIRNIMKIDLSDKGNTDIKDAFNMPDGYRIVSSRYSEYSTASEVTCIVGSKIFFIPCCSNLLLVYDTVEDKVYSKVFSVDSRRYPDVDKSNMDWELNNGDLKIFLRVLVD